MRENDNEEAVMNKKMKKVVIALIVLTMALFCAACGGGDEKAETGGTAGADTIRVAVSAEPDNLNPMLSSASDTEAIMLNVYEGLLSFDKEGNFLPALAESYKMSDDGLSYTFNLRKDIKFHDGKAFSAKDVKYTYEKRAGLAGEEPLSQTLADLLASVETPDEYTVILNLKHVDAGFLCRCVMPVQEEGYADDSTLPVGTGPYRFKEYVQGQKVVLEKNEDYNTVEEKIPEVQNVEFRIITDPNAVVMGLKSGDLDIAEVDPANADTLGEDFEIIEALRNNVQLMALNNDVKPFDNEKVRQAVNYAVNKEEIIKTVRKGHGTRVDSFLSPAMKNFYNDNLKTYETDIEKAKTLLKEAGYPDGIDMKITVPSNYQIHVETAQVIKSQLEKAGIRAEIETVEWAQWLDQVYTKENYQASIVGHSGKLDPQDFLNRFTTTYERNYFNYEDPAYDQLIIDAQATTDQEERAEIYRKCQQELVTHAAAVYIEDPNWLYAVNKKYTNMKVYPINFFDMGSIRLAK